MIALTKSLAKELADTKVLVNCVTPAAGRTDILKQMTAEHIAYMVSKIPMGRLVEPRKWRAWSPGSPPRNAPSPPAPPSTFPAAAQTY